MSEREKWEANRNEIFDEYGTLLARCCDDEFDNQIAQKIVHAVNCHDRLLKWVKLLREVHRARGVMGVSKEWGEFEALIAEAEGGGNG